MTLVIDTPLSAQEARRLVDEIHADVNALGEKLLRLKDGRGWKALGYESWRDCVASEFKQSESQLYRLLLAEQVNQQLQKVDAGLPKLKERVVRELNRLNSPEEKAEAYREAQSLAKTQGKSEPSARDVAAVVEKKVISKQVLATPYAVVSLMMVQGEITPQVGKSLTEELDKIRPRANVVPLMELMARYGLNCLDLVLPIAAMIAREGTDRPSSILPEIRRGYLNGVPLKQATMESLEGAREEARNQHIAEDIEIQRQKDKLAGKVVAEPKVVTIWKHDPVKTFKVLRQELSVRDLIFLQDLIQKGC